MVVLAKVNSFELENRFKLHETALDIKPSSETQGQIVGARESLNGRKNKARRKVKNGEKSPWGQDPFF